MADEDLAWLVDQLRRDRRRHPYEGRKEYSRAARAVIDGCAELIATGQASEAVPLLRKAVDRMTRALMYMDDSSGIVGNDLREMIRLYGKACTAAPPKPAALAKWLVTLHFEGPGWPRVVLREFAGVLGERGLAEVARLTEAAASAVDPQSSSNVYAARDFREQLADLSGDVDHYVAVLAENLNSPDQYERIAHALRSADRGPEAIAWARRGLADKPDWPAAVQLRDTLVDLLLTSGQTDAAMQVRREEFERRPTRAAYEDLKATGTKVGAGSSEAWALDILENRVGQQPLYAAELLDILLSLGHDDKAWQLGQTHREQLGKAQWLTLLEKRGTTRPADVITPYEELIEQHILNSADKQRYRRAVALLPALRDAHSKADNPAAFTVFLTDLRARHARRPTFIKTLNAANL